MAKLHLQEDGHVMIQTTSVLEAIELARVAFKMSHGKEPRFVVLGPEQRARLDLETGQQEQYTSYGIGRANLSEIYGLRIVGVNSNTLEIGW